MFLGFAAEKVAHEDLVVIGAAAVCIVALVLTEMLKAGRACVRKIGFVSVCAIERSAALSSM